MKFVSLRSSKSADELLGAISDNYFVNDGVNFGSSGIKPHMHVKEKKNGKIIIKCEMMGGPTKDNGFIEGTSFRGKITSCEQGSKLSGVILTAPIFHAALLVMVAIIICQCIAMKAVTVLPVFAVLFDLLLFKNEFKKQGYIQRYLSRAVMRLEKLR